MMDLLGDLKPTDAEFSKIIFDKGEIVKFHVKDFKIKEENGMLILRCDILSGTNAGKNYTIVIPPPENDIKRKQRAAFFFKTGLWTAAELESKDIKMARVVNRILAGEATKANPGKEEGVMFQDIMNLKDLGPAETPSATTEAGAAASQTTF